MANCLPWTRPSNREIRPVECAILAALQSARLSRLFRTADGEQPASTTRRARQTIGHRKRRTCDLLPIRKRKHQRFGHHGRNGKGFGHTGIGVVDDVAVQEILIVTGDLSRADLEAEFMQHFGGRSLDRLAADHRRHSDNRRRAIA